MWKKQKKTWQAYQYQKDHQCCVHLFCIDLSLTRVQEQFNDAEVGVGHAVMQGCVSVIIHHIDQELQHCGGFCGHFVNVQSDRVGTRVLLSTHVEPLLEHHSQSLPLIINKRIKVMVRKSNAILASQAFFFFLTVLFCELPFHHLVPKLHPCAFLRSDTRSWSQFPPPWENGF